MNSESRESMKAVICTRYGGPEVLDLQDIAKPQPKDNEVLIKTHFATVQTGDWTVMSLAMPSGMKFMSRLIFGFFGPRNPILGTELSGTIESVGESVTLFTPGMEVIAMTGMKFGAHAEYIALSENSSIVEKPKNISFQEAASLPFGGTTALDFLCNKARLQKGERVLVNGASGAVGIAAVQIARNVGCEVAAVCSGDHFDLVKKMGASHFVDYRKEDFWDQNYKYDIILDVVGNLRFSKIKSSMTRKGRLLLVSSGLLEILSSAWNSMMNSQKVICGVANEGVEVLKEVVDLTANGDFQAVIDREFSLEEIKEAYTLIEKRHKRGNFVLKI